MVVVVVTVSKKDEGIHNSEIGYCTKKNNRSGSSSNSVKESPRETLAKNDKREAVSVQAN